MGTLIPEGPRISRLRSCGCYALFFVLLAAVFVLRFRSSGVIWGGGSPSIQPASDVPGDIHDGRPLAVVIEPEESPSLIPLMLHHSSVLGPRWTVLLFTSESKWSPPSSPAFQRSVKEGRIAVRFLPSGADIKSDGDASLFTTKPWLWEKIQSAHRVLLWQADSVLCSRAPRAPEDLFWYDFVGDPSDDNGEGYDSNLSLWDPRLPLAITRDPHFEVGGAKSPYKWFLDEARVRVKDGVMLPSEEVSRTFTERSPGRGRPLGYSQPWKWEVSRVREVEEWCPEIRLAM